MFSGDREPECSRLRCGSRRWLPTRSAPRSPGRSASRSASARWLLAISVPTLVAMASAAAACSTSSSAPEVTVNAGGAGCCKRGARHARAADALHEKLVMGTFVGMVGLWASHPRRSGSTRLRWRFSALAFCLLSGVLTLDDIAKEGDVLAIYFWFARALHAEQSAQRARLHGISLASTWRCALGGLSPVATGLALVVAYVLLHYLFVSQTAHLLALFGVFLDVGVRLGVPATLLALPAAVRHQLLFRDHAAGIEREPSLRRKRLSVAGRACTGSVRSPRRSVFSCTS